MYNNVDSGSIILAIPKIVTVSKRTESPLNWGNKNCCKIAEVGRVLRKTSNYAAFSALRRARDMHVYKAARTGGSVHYGAARG